MDLCWEKASIIGQSVPAILSGNEGSGRFYNLREGLYQGLAFYWLKLAPKPETRYISSQLLNTVKVEMTFGRTDTKIIGDQRFASLP